MKPVKSKINLADKLALLQRPYVGGEMTAEPRLL